MSPALTAALTGLLIFGACIWVGGFIVIGVVAQVARRTLQPPDRVAFFRALGRSYGIVGTIALALAYGTGASLLYGRPWDATLTATTVVATALVLATATGVVQARRMSRLRTEALAAADDTSLADHVRHGAGRADVLRSVIGLLTLALLALGVLVGT